METKKINQNKKIGLTLLLIFVGVYLFSITWFFESNFLLQGVLVGTANIATTVGIIGPFVWLINRKKEKKEARRSYSILGVAMLIFLIHTVFIRSGTPLNNFFQLEWN
ncbi:hypothetical protein C7K38_00065 [Tetragenococcus osmophilus]|uniref:Uncharacterized protein n=1 Tax=Tetragenococcus osmophilus TaxID=526944 RepID=A0AA37XJN7_9ENTE|nr:hypothetical protein [Tetragenococcus osmophilus]AYW46901.1 hypothetical protein C7K38_00065 [Tetragenococcus osmophilus]GMA71281.1 hypothetical protein GCM10025885_03300 [Tetragenococcus osmophilus]